jgi:SHS2 domain-containing protein
MKEIAGFRELAHTADWELGVWADSLTGLLEQAALGMYKLSGTRLEPAPRQARRLIVDGIDAESLLVRFLSELLWLGEHEKVAFDRFELAVSNDTQPLDLRQPLHLQANLEGAEIASLSKEIKAVTYHDLAVVQTRNGLEARIVFDV